MAVTSCKLVDIVNTTFDSRNLMSCTAEFRIIDTIPDSTEQKGRGRTTILNEATTASPDNFPTHWDYFDWAGETDLYAYATNFKIDRLKTEASQTIYKATVEYRPAAPGEVVLIGGNGINATNPLLRPPVWNGDVDTFTKLIDQDKDGNPVVNSAGDPFDPTLERPAITPVVTATYNYTDLSTAMDVCQAMHDATNSSAWQGRAMREVWCTEARPMARVTEGVNTFHPVAFRFALSKVGKKWDDEILNRGLSYKKNAGDAKNVVSDIEVNLADDGTLLDKDGTGTFKPFRTRPEVNFTTTLGF